MKSSCGTGGQTVPWGSLVIHTVGIIKDSVGTPLRISSWMHVTKTRKKLSRDEFLLNLAIVEELGR
jgi:hypothetical protein